MRNTALALLLASLSVAGYAQHIPDANFANAIRQQCPTCIDANDDLLADAQTLMYLNVSGQNISNLTGIDGFMNLHNLFCRQNVLTSLPALPVNLSGLYCEHNQLTSLPALPTNLSSLYCSHNQLTSLPTLPASITTLYCSHNQLTTLPVLPSGLESLYCNNNQLTTLPTLSVHSMGSLVCSHNQITSLPSLADIAPVVPTWWGTGISMIDISHNQLTSLPAMPSNVERFYCNNNQLTVLSPLPDTASWIICDSNMIDSVNTLPNTLELFSAVGNVNLTCLPLLPQELTYLETANTNITCLPNFPPNLSTALPLCNTSNSTCYSYPELNGKVFADADNSCGYNGGEAGRNHYLVRVTDTSTGDVYYNYTDSNGDYVVWVPVGNYDVTAYLPANTPLELLSCQNSIQVNATTTGQVITNDFPVEVLANCAYLTVDIGTAFIRRCLNTPNYVVSYCNQGTIDAVNSYVDVALDPDMVVNSTSIPYTAMGNNVYRFQLGTVVVGDCGSFTIDYILDPNCDQTYLGQTHCVEAMIFPTLYSCAANTWGGAVIEVDGECQQDTVGQQDSISFTITNTGADMTGSRPYYVIEDNLILRTGNFQLLNGQIEIIKVPALPARTYRLEAWQEPGFPAYLGDTTVYVTVEGCVDSMGIYHTGWVTAYNTNDPAPFIDIDCRQSVGSCDPNAKIGYPIGYGAEHYIEAGQVLDYHIDFQNVGTDTAFNIVILDTLSPSLDPLSIEWGVASHAYSYMLLPGNVIRWSFADINLVDQATNEPLSHGFVEFSIHQRPNLSIGTIINNDAAIYFDLNAPVITNMTFHEIGEDFIEVSIVPIKTVESANVAVRVYPNPFREVTTIEVTEGNYHNLQLSLMDATGREQMRQASNNGSNIQLHRDQLPAGMYFYRIEADGQVLSVGKLIAE